MTETATKANPEWPWEDPTPEEQKNIWFRLNAAIICEQLAYADEKRKMAAAEGRDAAQYRAANGLAHLHRYALVSLLQVRDGEINRADLKLPCSDQVQEGK